MAVTMNSFWDDAGTVIPGGDAEYVVAEQPIAEYDNWFNYNIVADIQAVIDDVINKFNANTILKADTDNTPAALVVAEQTIVGRKTGNSIAALIDSEVLAIIGVEPGATADQTNNEIRDAVEAATDSNTFTDADHTKLNGVDVGADVTGSNPPQSHGASVHTNRARKMFVARPNMYSTGDASIYGIALASTPNETAIYNFKLPEDFDSFTSVKIVYGLPISTGVPKTVVINTTVRFGMVGELLTTHSQDTLGTSVTLDDGNIDTITLMGSSFTGITKNDYVYVSITRDTSHVNDDFAYDWVILGIEVAYIADM